jgi:uncharacterized protein DUF4345
MIGGYLSSVVLGASGLSGILIPDKIAPVLDTVFTSPRGRSEFRIAYGALAALGGWAVAVADHELFVAIGVFWLGAAAVRLIACAVDRPSRVWTYWAFLALEVVVGLAGVLGSG